MSGLGGWTLTIPARADLSTETCFSCGVVFAMAYDFYKQRLKDGRTFYCPAGHAQHYTAEENAQEKLKAQEATNVALRDQLSAAIRDGEATRAALVRDRSRFVNGVCPCCNRSFPNVRRHMATKHPDYDVSEVAAKHTATVFKCSCWRKFDTFAGLRIHQGRSRHDGWDSPKASRWAAHLTEVR